MKMRGECTCKAPGPPDWAGSMMCEIHEPCDDRCDALKDPTTVEELRAALDHARHHSWLHGCSHGG